MADSNYVEVIEWPNHKTAMLSAKATKLLIEGADRAGMADASTIKIKVRGNKIVCSHTQYGPIKMIVMGLIAELLAQIDGAKRFMKSTISDMKMKLPEKDFDNLMNKVAKLKKKYKVRLRK
jgi:hypothetical protein